jgi:hypothetical protein
VRGHCWFCGYEITCIYTLQPTASESNTPTHRAFSVSHCAHTLCWIGLGLSDFQGGKPFFHNCLLWLFYKCESIMNSGWGLGSDLTCQTGLILPAYGQIPNNYTDCVSQGLFETTLLILICCWLLWMPFVQIFIWFAGMVDVFGDYLLPYNFGRKLHKGGNFRWHLAQVTAH